MIVSWRAFVQWLAFHKGRLSSLDDCFREKRKDTRIWSHHLRTQKWGASHKPNRQHSLGSKPAAPLDLWLQSSKTVETDLCSLSQCIYSILAVTVGWSPSRFSGSFGLLERKKKKIRGLWNGSAGKSNFCTKLATWVQSPEYTRRQKESRVHKAGLGPPHTNHGTNAPHTHTHREKQF